MKAKRILAVILTFIMVCTFIPGAAFAAEWTGGPAASLTVSDLDVNKCTVTIAVPASEIAVKGFTLAVQYDPSMVTPDTTVGTYKVANKTKGISFSSPVEGEFKEYCQGITINSIDTDDAGKTLFLVTAAAADSETGITKLGFSITYHFTVNADVLSTGGVIPFSISNGIYGGDTPKFTIVNLSGETAAYPTTGNSGTLVIPTSAVAVSGTIDATTFKSNTAPVMTLTAPEGFTVTPSWSPELKDGKFEASKDYTLTVKVEESTGKFASNATVTADQGLGLSAFTKTPATDAAGAYYTATRAVAIPAKTLVSIAVTQVPTKTDYVYGDEFDTTGMVITATYDDQSTEEVADTKYTVAPLKAGDTVATISYGGQTVTTPVTVNKAPNPAALTATTASVKFGNTLDLSTLVQNAQGDVSFTNKEGSTLPSGSALSGSTFTAGNNAGSCVIKVSAAGNENYNSNDLELTVNVIAKDPQSDFTFAEHSQTKTYGDEPFTVTATGAVSGSTVTYASSNLGVAEVNASTGAVTIKGVTGDAPVTITATASETADYAAATATYSLSINQKDVTITGLSAENKEYDGLTSARVKGTGQVDGLVGQDTVTIVDGTASFDNKNVGTNKTVTFTGYSISGEKAANYNLRAQPESVTADITAKEVTATVTATDRDYVKDNKEVTLVAGVVSGYVVGEDVTVDVFAATGTMDDDNAGTGKNVTVTGVKLGGTDAGNYSLAAQPTGVTVNIAKIDYAGSKTATGEEKYGKAGTVDLSALLADGYVLEALSVSDANAALASAPTVQNGILSYTFVNDAAKIGKTVTITVPVTSSTNYNAYNVTVTLTVLDKYAQTIAFAEQGSITKTYGDAKFTNAANRTVGDGEVYYVSSDTTKAEVNEQTGEVTIKGATGDAANVTITAVAKETAEYSRTTAEYTLTINKAALTVTAKPKTIIYGNEPANDGVTYAGFVNGESENTSGIFGNSALSYDYTYAQYQAVGTGKFQITPKGLESANYTIAFVSGDLTVEKKEVGLNWGEAVLTYNGSEQAPEATATYLVNNDTCTVVVSGQKKNVGGGYTATATSLSNDNYKLPANKTTAFSIAKKVVEVSWTAASSYAYTGEELAKPTATFTGVGSDGTLTCDVTEDSGKTFKDAGTYNFTASTKEGNYTLKESTAKKENVVVSKAAYGDQTASGFAKRGERGTADLRTLLTTGGEATLGTVTANNILETGEAYAVTLDSGILGFTVKQNANGDPATVEVNVAESANYGAYKITVTLTASEKAAQKLAFAEATLTKTYGDGKFTYTATLSEGDGNVTYSVPQGNSVATLNEQTGEVTINRAGEVIITATAAATNDYAATTASYKLTVEKATVTVKAYTKEITVGDQAPDLSAPEKGTHYTVTGLVGADALTGVKMRYSKNGTFVDAADVKTDAAGSYDIEVYGATLDNDSKDNYKPDIVYQTGKLTIKTATSGDDSGTPSVIGGGGGGSTNHKIETPASTEHGTISVSPTTAAKGDKVTITAKSDAGYKAEKPVVTDKDGKEIPLTENADGTWSFIMPDGEVKVSGKFVEDKKQDTKEKFVDVPADAWYHDDVYWAVDKGVTTGVDDTHFAPNADCTRAQFVTFLWRAAGKPAPSGTANPFEDVKADAYYYDAVLWAVEKGVTKGTDETHFTPDASVTRAEAMTFLYRHEQMIGKGFTGLWAFQLDFPDAADVPDWAYEAFCWMVKEGVCKGSDGMLLPGAICPRCEVVALLARIFGA